MADPVPAGSDVSAGTYKCTSCGNELSVGDKLVGMVLESIYNLNNRTIDQTHIQSLERYARK